LNHHASPDFWARYDALPVDVQRLADEAFKHMKRDPRYPAIRLKKVGRLWSARVGASYRALASDGPDGPVWFWIGTHAEYDKLLG
jgi:hypothetical protein